MTVIEQLRAIQADAHALYIKVHNYHWNVQGLQFESIHKKTEAIYEAMSELFDDVAERVLQLGEKPYVTLKELAANSRVAEETRDRFTAADVVEGLMGDYEHLLGAFRKLAEAADEAGDPTTQALAEDQIAGLEKDLWMLRAMSA